MWKVERSLGERAQEHNFESDHLLEHKLEVVRTLHQHACTVIMEKGERDIEIEQMNKGLKHCGYPDWALTNGAAFLQPHDQTNREKGKTSEGYL